MEKAIKKIIAVVCVLFALLLCGGAIYFYKINVDVLSPNIEVVFDAEGFDVDKSEIKIRKGNCVSLPSLSKEGYDFDGWFCGDQKIEENTPIKQNSTLKPKFTPKKFKITFVVDGQKFYAQCDYDSIPSFPSGTPQKAPTETTQFDFVGYNPALSSVVGEAEYEAVFVETVRKFNVNLTPNIASSCNLVYEEKVEYGESTTISVTENEGYRFVGWFDGNELFNSNKSVVINNVKTDINLIAKLEIIDYNLVYVAPTGAEFNNTLTYNVTMNNVALNDASLDGHVFVGWFTQPDGKGEQVFVLNISVVKVHTTFYAYFSETVSVKFVVDGLTLSQDEVKVKIGETLTKPLVNTSRYGMGAQTIDGWFLQSNCAESSRFDFATIITGELTLYGKWEYVLDNGFFDYLDEFNTAKSKKSILIDSEEKLIRYIEFVEFNNITSSEAISIKFGTKNSDFKVQFNTVSELSEYVQSVINKSEYPNGTMLSYNYVNLCPFTLNSIYVANNPELSTLKNADPTSAETSTQYEFGFLTQTAGRSVSFDNFNINKIQQTARVSTSNQLVYVLEKGLRPICESGSNAEKVYNKAKDVLRQICDDNMMEFEKIKAIYDWLILNVQYDSKAASSSIVMNNWQEYDAWYPEGVFFNHKAVCDGISRSLVILARIENIGAIRVSGLHKGTGHAWNKVLIDGNWFGIDATHGAPICGNEEILTYSSFLFSDEYKQTCCTFDIKKGTETKTKLNVYEKMTFGEGIKSFDLFINSKTEMSNLAVFVKAYASNSSYYEGHTNHSYFTIEFAISSSSGVSVSYACTILGVHSYYAQTAENGINAYCFVIKF